MILSPRRARRSSPSPRRRAESAPRLASRLACGLRAGALLACGLLLYGCTADELWGDPDEDGGTGIIVIPPPPTDTIDLFGVSSQSDNLFLIDPRNGQIVFVGALNPDSRIFTTPVSMAVREPDGTIFVWNNGDPLDPPGPSGTLLTVDVCTGFGSPVDPTAPRQGELQGLAFIGSELFGVGGVEDGEFALFTVSTADGALERVSADAAFAPVGGLDSDVDGSLLGLELGGDATRTEPLRLFRLDPDTGTATETAMLDASIVRGDALVRDGDEFLAGGVNRQNQTVFFRLDAATGQILQVFVTVETVQGMAFAPSCAP